MTDKFSLVPRTMTEAIDYSKVIADSNFCPKEYRGRPGDVLVAVQYGMELGIMPLQALQGIAIINGKPCIWGDLALAVVRGSGLVEDFEETDPSEAAKGGRAVCTAKRKGQVSPISRSFTIDDAKKAGLWGKAGPWAQYPGRMLVMRARSWTLRDGFADVLKGLQTREEVMDYTDVQATVVPAHTVAPKVNVGKIASEIRAAEPKRPAITVAVDPNPTVTFDGENIERIRDFDPGEPPMPPWGDNISGKAREPGCDDDGAPDDLRAIITRIAEAKNERDLAAVAVDAGQLEPSLLGTARAAYKARLNELRGAK